MGSDVEHEPSCSPESPALGSDVEHAPTSPRPSVPLCSSMGPSVHAHDRSRVIDPETIPDWFGFRFTWRPPSEEHKLGRWQATCRYHLKSTGSACKKTITVTEEWDKAYSLRLCKQWAVDCVHFSRQRDHVEYRPGDFEVLPDELLDVEAVALPPLPAVVRRDDELDLEVGQERGFDSDTSYGLDSDWPGTEEVAEVGKERGVDSDTSYGLDSDGPGLEDSAFVPGPEPIDADAAVGATRSAASSSSSSSGSSTSE